MNVRKLTKIVASLQKTTIITNHEFEFLTIRAEFLEQEKSVVPTVLI